MNTLALVMGWILGGFLGFLGATIIWFILIGRVGLIFMPKSILKGMNAYPNLDVADI